MELLAEDDDGRLMEMAHFSLSKPENNCREFPAFMAIQPTSLTYPPQFNKALLSKGNQWLISLII